MTLPPFSHVQAPIYMFTISKQRPLFNAVQYIEHEQIINISSNRRMKQLMDWLSNSH